MKRPAFGPRWLRAHLAQLLPEAFPDAALCVAFSGGADSTALLAALAQGSRAPFSLRAVHVHHGLHADAGRWSAHCAGVAHKLGVPFKAVRVEVKRTRGTSLEAEARDARYAALAAALAPGEILLTAHHADDQLETVFLQLLRGAGIAGLAAMPEVAAFARGVLARPLLTRSRDELLAFLKEHELPFIDDASNADERLDRNYLRRNVIPAVLARWPSAAASVARSARHAAEAQRLLEELGKLDANRAADGAALSVKELRALTPEHLKNALRFWITARGWPAPDARRLAQLAGPVLQARADAHPVLSWEGVTVYRDADRLHAKPPDESQTPHPQVTWDWRATPRLVLAAGMGELEIKADAHGPIDLERLPVPLLVRPRRGGERLQPDAQRPRRALKTLLQEAPVPAALRAHLPLLFAAEHLVAVADLWSDVSVRAHGASARRARIIWRRN